jgi:RNase P/RNase MRP subunit POP5
MKKSHCKLHLRANPPIEDPKEVHTILLFSLRKLWGELENHSRNVVSFERHPYGHPGEFVLLCTQSSLAEIRAALVLVTPPSYLADQLYTIDVISVEEVDLSAADG